jgi:hypothetical protein
MFNLRRGGEKCNGSVILRGPAAGTRRTALFVYTTAPSATMYDTMHRMAWRTDGLRGR